MCIEVEFMRTQKLDGRFKGSHKFKYASTFRHAEAGNFIEIRNWCWATWGPSAEYDIIHKMPEEPCWCWISDDYRMRLMFATEKEYNWFCLKWKK